MNRVFKWLMLALIVVEASLVGFGLLDVATAVGIVVGIEVLLLLLAVRQIVVAVRSYRRKRAAGLDVWEAMGDGLATLLPRRVARVVAMEPKLWFCLVTWLLRRHESGQNEFCYRKRSLAGPLLLVVLITTPVELLLFELLVPWAWLRWVLLVLAVYALIWAFGFYASLVVLPHRLEASGIRLHHGILAEGLIPYAAIHRIEHKPRRAPGIGDGFRLVKKEEDAYLVVGGKTDVSLYLRSACSLKGFLGPTMSVATVHVAVDEPQRLVRDLEKRVCSEAAKPGKSS